MEISSTFWLRDIPDWWRQQEETLSKYTDPSDVASDIFYTIPHDVGVESKFSLGRDFTSWRQPKTTADTFHQKNVLRQFAWANTRILAGDDPVLDTQIQKLTRK